MLHQGNWQQIVWGDPDDPMTNVVIFLVNSKAEQLPQATLFPLGMTTAGVLVAGWHHPVLDNIGVILRSESKWRSAQAEMPAMMSQRTPATAPRIQPQSGMGVYVLPPVVLKV